MTETPTPSTRAGCARTALFVGGALLTVALGGAFYLHHRASSAEAEAVAAQEQAASEAFEPALEAMEPPPPAPELPAYDLDKTIRVIHEIDQALAESDDLEDYLHRVSLQDYRGVAPEVLDARRDILEILLQIYGKQTEAEDQAAMWEFTSELFLSTLSVVEVEGSVNPAIPVGSFSVDREQAQELLTDMKDRQADRRRLVREINALEEDLFHALTDYSETYYQYVEEWDRLSTYRDRAYLAVRNRQWDIAAASAEQAIELAPMEREAHLLRALALIEGGDAEDDPEIGELLDGYLVDHPDYTAPAFLLLGVWEGQRGNTEEALLHLQQSAAYYPRQAEHLTDMLDPYRMRSFLRKSREGTVILEEYQNTMLGSGAFSPDLQMAEAMFEAGDFAGGRTKVLDHFARRRAQEQWNFILSDIAFCHDMMGPYYREIFPEESWLDLEVHPTTWGSGLKVSVQNRSARTLHNATLVLALHMTDMHPGDYVTLSAPATQPAVLAHDTTSFGSIDVAVDLMGTTKGVEDIVHHRAILVTDEAVLWVDTDAFRIAEAEEFREARRHASGPLPEPSYRSSLEDLATTAGEEAVVELEERSLGADNVLVTLPKELSILKPIFRLRYGDEVYTASDNLIDGDHIALRFRGVGEAEEVTADDLELMVHSPFGDVVLDWAWDGEVSWRLQSVEEDDLTE